MIFDEDNKEDIDKLIEEYNKDKMLMEMIGKITKDPKLIAKSKLMSIVDKLDYILLFCEEKKFEGAVNIIDQVYQLVNDYIKENNIKVKEIK